MNNLIYYVAPGLGFFFFMISRWRLAFLLLLIYLPFGGGLATRFDSAVFKIAKDVLFIIPGYIGFFIFSRHQSQIKVPLLITLGAFYLLVVAIVELFNPNLKSFSLGLVGLHVWFSYIPLIFVGYALLRNKGDLLLVFRTMLVVSWIPCVVGLIQWYMCGTWGYEKVMLLSYGPKAFEMSHGMESFDYGEETLYRLPSTFAWVTHYFDFTIAMMPIAFSLFCMETKKRWKYFSLLSLFVLIAASMLCGARAAFMFVPLYFLILFVLELGNPSARMRLLFVIPSSTVAGVFAAAVYFDKIFDAVINLFFGYSESIVKRHLILSFQAAPWGRGTGMNTAAGRWIAGSVPGAFESYYAKAIYEFGAPGLCVVLLFFSSIVFYGFNAWRNCRDDGMTATSASLLAFIVIVIVNSLKGFGLDWDPWNIYFWLFSGFLLKLPDLKVRSG